MKFYRITFALLLAASCSAWAQTGPEVALNGFVDDLQTYQADFEQVVYDDTGREVERSSGSIALQSPNLFRWKYEDPFEQLIVADGSDVWSYDIDLEQVTVREQDAAAGQSPLVVLTEPETLKDRYAIEGRFTDGDICVLRLTPREDTAELDFVELTLEGNRLTRMEIADGFGQLTAINFMRTQRNTPLDAATFSFTPPEGIDVLRDIISLDDPEF